MLSPDIFKDRRKMAMYTPEEKELLKTYFAFSGGCFKKPLSDEDYYSKVRAKQQSLGLYQKALKKIGLDEEELKEIPPIEIVGFVEKDSVTGPSGRYTNKYETTWLMFSNKQLYIYSYTFDMLSKTVKEHTEEYFYKDVTNITTVDEDVEINVTTLKGCSGSNVVNKKEIKQISSLKIIVPGDSLYCSIDPNGNTDIEQKIKAVKAKLREMKQ